MKIIIVHASVGKGHSKAAGALYNYLRQQRKDVKADIVDVLEKSNFFFKFSYRYGYSFLIRRLPLFWKLGFWITYLRPLRQFSRTIVSFLNRLSTTRFADFLIRENPDCIISTHFLPAEISAYLKTNRKIKSKVVAVITDFGVHPFWVSCGTDLYAAASEPTRQRLIDEGVVEESIIRVFGIPVDSKFLSEFNKDELSVKFNLGRDKFTILIITGSFGTGPIEEIVEQLLGEVQIIVVCANNKKLFRRLSRKDYPDVRIFGFVDNIQELMAVSDMIITKPGGLGIAESLVMELFPVFIVPIPGQETENMRILAEYGLGIKATNVASIKETILDFRDHPQKLIEAREIIRKLKKPFAAKDICDAVC